MLINASDIIMSKLVEQLGGGNRRSIGRSNAVAREVAAEPLRFAEIIDGLTHGDQLIRMRSADVAEKVSRRHPDWLQPYKQRLLELAEGSEEQELRWHLAQMLPRLDLANRERRRTEAILREYLKDESRIVQTFALQGLADLSVKDPKLRRTLLPLIDRLQREGSSAVRARARKLRREWEP
jgi:HEAT repeat protein